MSYLRNSNFVGTAKRLEDIDLPRIASRIDCGEDELHAFMDVEAAGSGFDKQDRPKMLFEPHVFYRNLSGPQRDQAVRAGLAYPKWGQEPYPKDSYPRLKEAMMINETAAMLACSWGLGQILGENYKIVGYDSVQAMVLDFMEDEENHLEAMVQFLIANNIADDLAAHRWAVVARVYNGPGYAKNQYDVKLERAFARWAKIPDTPWNQPVLKNEVEYPVVRRGDEGEFVEALQRELVARGYDIVVDGDFGPKTEGAVRRYQSASDLVSDGIVGKRTWSSLLHI